MRAPLNAPHALQHLDTLAAALGHQFHNLKLLEEALTHPSVEMTAGRRRNEFRDYNRLEFLGDRVLGVIVAELLHERFPAAEAGELARRFNALVRQESLARVAQSLGLGEYLRLSKSERDMGGAAKPAILADACEAIIAALYLDGGLEAARSFVRRQFEPRLAELGNAAKDAKTALQEWAAARSLAPPVYEVTQQKGPPHDPTFTVTVRLDGQGEITGEGRTKRSAEQAAARALLKSLPRSAA